MIIVTGSILAREDTFDDVLRSCIEHVERSRKEPGCISHDVHVDCQNPMRLFFFERWEDEAALRTHFAVEGSKAFVKSLKGWIVETSGTNIYRVIRRSGARAGDCTSNLRARTCFRSSPASPPPRRRSARSGSVRGC
jgi:quinol monooxygenase YgiN